VNLPDELPLVTVIMPIRNEVDFIERSLGAVLKQDYPPDKIEVLIADGMSDDGTVKIIESLPGAERVRIIQNPERIQSHGLNRLIPLAKGDYVVRIDGHTIIAPNYVRQCVATLWETGAENAGGAMDPVGVTPSGKAISAAGKSPFAVPSVFHVSSTPQYTDTVYCGAWPRRVFDEVGLFSTDVGVNEDYEFNYRIRAYGGKIYYNPAIKSTYYGRQTWSHLARQYYRYGRSKIKTLRKHPESLRLRQAIAPLFIAGLVVGLPLIVLIPPLGWLYLGVILLYGILGLIFATRVAANNREDISVWRVMFTFIIMHITWGLGFWRELIKPAPL
jgi:succinoglycan biosynthesis protein ExoA